MVSLPPSPVAGISIRKNLRVSCYGDAARGEAGAGWAWRAVEQESDSFLRLRMARPL